MFHNYCEKYFIDASMSNFWTCFSGSYFNLFIKLFQGDSGGPLTYKQKAKNWKRQHVLIGVVSWGNGCAKVTP